MIHLILFMLYARYAYAMLRDVAMLLREAAVVATRRRLPPMLPPLPLYASRHDTLRCHADAVVAITLPLMPPAFAIATLR